MCNITTGTTATIKHIKDDTILGIGTVAVSADDKLLVNCSDLSKNLDYIKTVAILINGKGDTLEVYEGTVVSYDDSAVVLTELRLLTGVERRRDERVTSVIPSAISVPGAENINATIMNISISGVLLKSNSEFNVHDKVKLRFSLSSSSGLGIYEGEGEIVRFAGDVHNSHQYGVRFTDAKDDNYKNVQQYVTKLLGKKDPEQLDLRIRGRRG